MSLIAQEIVKEALALGTRPRWVHLSVIVIDKPIGIVISHTV